MDLATNTFNNTMKETEWKTKEQFNCIDWIDFRNHYYKSMFDKKTCTWYYKFIY